MAATPAPAAGGENPYGLMKALSEGGIIAQVTFGILVIMSVGSWYIFFVKLFEQQKIIKEGRRARTTFWQSANLREGANKLDKNGAYRQIVDDGLLAQEQHNKLTDPIDQHDWMMNASIRTSRSLCSSRRPASRRIRRSANRTTAARGRARRAPPRRRPARRPRRRAPRGRTGRPAPRRVVDAAGSWPAPRAARPGRRTSAACPGRSRRRRGGRARPGTGRARVPSTGGSSPRRWARQLRSGRSRNAATDAASPGPGRPRPRAADPSRWCTLCGNERSTSCTASASRLRRPARGRRRAARTRQPATGRPSGSTANVSPSTRIAASRRSLGRTRPAGRRAAPRPGAAIRVDVAAARRPAGHAPARPPAESGSAPSAPHARRTNGSTDVVRTASAGSSNSPRSTTAERASITSSTLGTSGVPPGCAAPG